MSRFLLMLALIVALPAHADTETEIRTALDYFAQVWNEDDLEAMQGYFHACGKLPKLWLPNHIIKDKLMINAVGSYAPPDAFTIKGILH